MKLDLQSLEFLKQNFYVVVHHHVRAQNPYTVDLKSQNHNFTIISKQKKANTSHERTNGHNGQEH